MAEAEPRCVMGGLAGGELRVEVELPGCSAGVPPPPSPPPPALHPPTSAPCNWASSARPRPPTSWQRAGWGARARADGGPPRAVGDIELEIQKRSGGGGLLLHLRVPGRFCLDRPLPPSIPLYTAVQTKFRSKSGRLAIILTVPPGAAALGEPAAAALPGGEDAAVEGVATHAEPPRFDEGRLVKPSEWATLMAGDGDDPFVERERIDAELEAELSSMRRQFAAAAP